MTHTARISDTEPAALRALFNQDTVCVVDAAMIERLKVEASRSPLGRYRLCMHHSTDDAMQDMIVVHRLGNYSRPHYHPDAAMSYTMIEGRMDVLIFDNTGAVIQRVHLGYCSDPDADTVSLHLSAGTIYMPVCLTEAAVFHETLSAPNPDGRATCYAAWSPTEDEPERIAVFLRRLGIVV